MRGYYETHRTPSPEAQRRRMEEIAQEERDKDTGSRVAAALHNHPKSGLLTRLLAHAASPYTSRRTKNRVLGQLDVELGHPLTVGAARQAMKLLPPSAIHAATKPILDATDAGEAV